MFAHLIRRRHRVAGFTLLEAVIVMALIGLMAAMVGPRLSRSYAAAGRRSADREVTAFVFRARAAAIQRSRTSKLVRMGNALQVWLDSSGTLVALGVARDMNAVYGVTLGASPTDTIQFDPRGFAVVGAQTPKLTVTSMSGVDTVCVMGLGRITTRSCI